MRVLLFHFQPNLINETFDARATRRWRSSSSEALCWVMVYTNSRGFEDLHKGMKSNGCVVSKKAFCCVFLMIIIARARRSWRRRRPSSISLAAPVYITQMPVFSPSRRLVMCSCALWRSWAALDKIIAEANSLWRRRRGRKIFCYFIRRETIEPSSATNI